MFFQKTFDGGCKHGVSCFWGISRYARYFGKNVTSAFVTAAAAIDSRCFPTYWIVKAFRFALIHHLHKGLDSPQAARKSAIGVGVNQHLVYFVDGRPGLQCSDECRFQMFQIAFACIGCHRYNGSFTSRQHLVCSGITAFRFGRGFMVLLIAYRREPYRRIVLRIGGNGDMRKPTVRCCSMPMLHIGSDFHNVTRKQPAGRLPFLLIVAYACGSNQYLPALVQMPTVATTRSERDVEHRNVQFPMFAQRCEPNFTRKIGIGRYLLTQRIRLAECFCGLGMYAGNRQYG